MGNFQIFAFLLLVAVVCINAMPADLAVHSPEADGFERAARYYNGGGYGGYGGGYGGFGGGYGGFYGGGFGGYGSRYGNYGHNGYGGYGHYGGNHGHGH